MEEKDKGGRPTVLHEEIIEQLVLAVPYYLIPTQCAYSIGISQQNLSNWLKQGSMDVKEGISSLPGRLFVAFKKAQAKEVAQIIGMLRMCPKNYQALTWLLERCFREDFGGDSEELKELRELFKQILPMIGKGVSYGKEVDSKNAHEEGSPA